MKHGSWRIWMVGFSKYSLLALTAVTLGIPSNLAAQAKHSSQKTGLRDEQSRQPSVHSELRKESPKTFLHKDWQVQSSCDVKAGGDKISAVGYAVERWHRTDIPATVVGVLVTDKTYPDPDYGTNLKNFPGIYIAENKVFANVDMPAGSPFACSWWFRTEFTAPADAAGKIEWLHFNGINYRANIWLNGRQIADAKDVAGTYRTFEFNVTKFLKRGERNALAVEVFAPGKDDLGITWVDWNPTPPDKDMGIWKEVFLTQSAAVSVRIIRLRPSQSTPIYRTVPIMRCAGCCARKSTRLKSASQCN